MAMQLFDTAPWQDYLSFYEGKKPQYNRVVKYLDFNQADVSQATGVSRGSIRYDNKIPAELRDRISEWATLLNHVAGHFKGYILKTT